MQVFLWPVFRFILTLLTFGAFIVACPYFSAEARRRTIFPSSGCSSGCNSISGSKFTRYTTFVLPAVYATAAISRLHYSLRPKMR
jgi:hypothetical protein